MTNEQVLENAEGFRPQPYRCSAGKETIGIGRCFEDNPFDSFERAVLRLDKGRNWIDEPMTHDEAVHLLRKDIRKSRHSLTGLLTQAALDRLPSEARDILMRMIFQMGLGGVQGFRQMRAALTEDPPNFAAAADEMLDSEWYRNRHGGGTPERAKAESDRMRAIG